MLLAGILPDRNSPALRVKQFLLQGGNLGRKKIPEYCHIIT